MTRRTTLIAFTMLLVLTGASCTGGSDSVEVPGAGTIGVAADQSASTTTSSTEPPVATEIPTPTPAPTTTEPPSTTAPPATDIAPPAPTPAPETTEGRNPDFLRQGDAGPRIGLIQFKLVALGYLPAGGDTAVFDGATNGAVLAFQGDYGLIVDGIIGPETERAISAAAESINPEQT
jgi:peptidoglycan hydrolase-like protein with peptidoglycan-binding domain